MYDKYRKIKLKFRERVLSRVASAKTAMDFVAIWLVILSLHFICGTIIFLIEKLGEGDEYDFWVSGGASYLSLILFLLFGLITFKFRKSDVRFWDPRVHWSEKYSGKIDVEKLRKIHTDYYGISLIDWNFLVLFIGIIFIPIFMLL